VTAASVVCVVLFLITLWVIYSAPVNRAHRWKHMGDHPFKFEDGTDPNAHHSNYQSSGSGPYR
jgi:hypothetical protein